MRKKFFPYRIANGDKLRALGTPLVKVGANDSLRSARKLRENCPMLPAGCLPHAVYQGHTHALRMDGSSGVQRNPGAGSFSCVEPRKTPSGLSGGSHRASGKENHAGVVLGLQVRWVRDSRSGRDNLECHQRLQQTVVAAAVTAYTVVGNCNVLSQS